MKKVLLPILLAFVSFASRAQYEVYNIVTTSGFKFSPDSITIGLHDTVVFTTGSIHDVTQVADTTYWANGSTPFPSGYFLDGGEIDSIVFDTVGTFYFVCSPHAKSDTMKGKIVIKDLTTSLPTSSAVANGIKIYPNPALSNVTLQLPQAMLVQSISLINAQGSEVLNQNLQSSISSHSLNVSTLEKGIYQVVISSTDKRYVSKIVIQ